MPPKRPVATATRYRTYALLLGLVAAAVGATIGHAVGARVAHGFRFDWYAHAGSAAFEATEVILPAGLLAAGLAFVLTPLLAHLAFRVWDVRLKKAKAPAADPEAVTRDARTVLTTLALTTLLGLGMGLAAFTGLFAAGVALVSPDGLRDVMAVTGGVSGFLAAFFAFAWTGDALAAGRVVTKPGENLIGKLSVLASRHGKAVVAVVVVLTAVMAHGASTITTDVDVADVLPRGNPNTAAAHNVSESFKSSFTQQATFMVRVADEETWAADNARMLPHRQSEGRPGNITDEVYVRAMAQLLEFVKTYEGSPFEGSVAVSDLYQLINWTIAGGRNAGDEAFRLPDAQHPMWAQHHNLVHEGVWTAIPDSADALISPDYEQSSVLVTVSPQEEMSSKEIGEWALNLRDAYVAWAEESDEAYKVWTGDNAPMFSVDLPIANAHASSLAEHDFETLLPVIAVFIIATLFIAFRNWTSIAVAFSTLAAAVIITFGAMGYLRIPLNTLNLTTLPLIMGVGIDYAIHMLNEYQEMRARGKSQEDAWRYAGGGSALALFVATLTTVSGLLVMIASPSLLIAQLGLLATIAMVSCFTLAIVFIPAFTSVLGGGSTARTRYTPSALMPGIGRAVSRFRVVAVILLLFTATAAYASSQDVWREPFGDPPRNWLEDDPLRQEHERALEGFYSRGTGDVKANIIVFEGDITDPQAHAYMDAIEASLKTKERIIDDTLRTLPFLVRTYMTVRDGVPGAAGFLGSQEFADRMGNEQADPYPRTSEEIEVILNEMHETPIGNLANLFYDYPENSMAMMLFSVDAATYEDAEVVWESVWEAINENEDLKPEGLRVSFVGNTATNYLFVAEQVPWLGYMAAATNVIVFGIVIAATGRVKPAIAVASASLLTSLVLLGLLPRVGIGLAITLTIPLIFIFSMGSDYTLHLGLRCIREGDTERALATVGKGVLFSFLTTAGAFLIFTQASDLAMRRTMLATMLAITAIMAVTLVLVPLFWPVRKGRDRDEGEAEPPAGERFVAVPVQGRRRADANGAPKAPADGEAPRLPD